MRLKSLPAPHLAAVALVFLSISSYTTTILLGSGQLTANARTVFTSTKQAAPVRPALRPTYLVARERFSVSDDGWYGSVTARMWWTLLQKWQPWRLATGPRPGTKSPEALVLRNASTGEALVVGSSGQPVIIHAEIKRKVLEVTLPPENDTLANVFLNH